MPRRALPAIVLVPLLIVALVVSTSACETMLNFAKNEPPAPYGGVAIDLDMAAHFDPVDKPGQIMLVPFVLLDLCISAGLDTVTLPVVLFKKFHATDRRIPEVSAVNSPIELNREKVLSLPNETAPLPRESD
jgi:uncharacterized protein YceK